jgi:hypothetical protein
MKKIETTFHLSDEVVTALKMKAVQEKRRFSEVVEDALREYLSLGKLKKEKKQKT